jgi:hypothetical protein
VWAWIVVDYLVVQHVLPHRLTGNPYRDFPLHDLPKLLEDVPLSVRARVWYMHDGAPAHFNRAVRDVLSNTNRNRWIGRGGPTAWPPPSKPDLNPLNFYLWGHVKALLKTKRHFTVALLVPLIRNTIRICERTPQSVMRRIEACIGSHGEQSRNLL